MKHGKNNDKSPNSRPLKVGEAIRHAMADIFLRGELYDPVLDGASITVSEVRVSPDLKTAIAFVMPLAGGHKEEILDALERASQEVRRQVAERVEMRYTPRIQFRLDTSYEEAGKINALLKESESQKDKK